MSNQTKKSEPKQHHIFSRFYLAGFTSVNGKKPKLIVLRKEEKKILENQCPRKVGRKRDFNRLDILDPYKLESSLLSDLETKAEQAIRALEKTLTFENEKKKIILKLMALYAARNPHRRKSIADTQNIMIEAILNKMLCAPIGTYINGGKITEELKHTIRNTKTKVIMPRNDLCEIEFGGVDIVKELLFQRKWLLVQAPADHFFITSDNPVNLQWTYPEKHNPRTPIGFGSLGTTVYFPLTKKLALIGIFDGPEGTIVSDSHTLACANSQISHAAIDQIYTPEINFHFINEADGNFYVDQFKKSYWGQ